MEPLISIHGVLNSTPALKTNPGVNLDLQVVIRCPLITLFQSITKEQCKHSVFAVALRILLCTVVCLHDLSLLLVEFLMKYFKHADKSNIL